MYTITTQIYMRDEFKKKYPDKKILDGRATYFTSDYVEWLERELNKLRLSNVSNSLPLDGTWNFAMFMKDWHKHSSGEHFYKSKNFHQWPPDETATKDELLRRFFGQ